MSFKEVTHEMEKNEMKRDKVGGSLCTIVRAISFAPQMNCFSCFLGYWQAYSRQMIQAETPGTESVYMDYH